MVPKNTNSHNLHILFFFCFFLFFKTVGLNQNSLAHLTISETPNFKVSIQFHRTLVENVCPGEPGVERVATLESENCIKFISTEQVDQFLLNKCHKLGDKDLIEDKLVIIPTDIFEDMRIDCIGPNLNYPCCIFLVFNIFHEGNISNLLPIPVEIDRIPIRNPDEKKYIRKSKIDDPKFLRSDPNGYRWINYQKAEAILSGDYKFNFKISNQVYEFKIGVEGANHE